MGFFFSLSIILLSFTTTTLQSLASQTPQIDSAPNLDTIVRDYTLRSFRGTFKTGQLRPIHLPGNLSTINVDTIRLRCNTLQKHGIRIQEFNLDVGITITPCNKRAILVRQNFGPKWSSVYFNGYQFPDFELVSSIVGLFAYDVIAKNDTNNEPSELAIHAGKEAIVVDFGKSSGQPNDTLCALFDRDGNVHLSNRTRGNGCMTTRGGHFGLVVETVPLKGRVSKWEIVTVSSVGGALGASLLSLLGVAMCVKAKKKARMDEMERRAYEEEALQVSMVGHVRAVMAAGTRTVPTIDHSFEYRK